MGIPPVLIHFSRIFPFKPSSYLGTPIYGTPQLLFPSLCWQNSESGHSSLPPGLECLQLNLSSLILQTWNRKWLHVHWIFSSGDDRIWEAGSFWNICLLYFSLSYNLCVGYDDVSDLKFQVLFQFFWAAGETIFHLNRASYPISISLIRTGVTRNSLAS